MNIIGLDISPTSTGVAVITPTEELVAVCKHDSYLDWIDMAEDIVSHIATVDACNAVFIEDYAFGMLGKSSSFTVIAEICGVVKYHILTSTHADIYLVASTTIKKYATGSGKGDKSQMRLAIYKKYGKEFNTTDECDAFVIADFGYHVLSDKPKRELLKYELETIGAYKKRNYL